MSRVPTLRFIEPQLASPENQPPEGKLRVEVKHLAGSEFLRHATVTAFACYELIEGVHSEATVKR